MINVHNVIIVLKLFNEKAHELDVVLVIEGYVVGGDLGLFRRQDLVACALQDADALVNGNNTVAQRRAAQPVFAGGGEEAVRFDGSAYLV